MKIKQILSTLMMLSLICGATFIIPVKHVFAASCSGFGCDGKLPQDTGCDVDGRTFVSTYIKNGSGANIGLVELRGSPSCGTNWSRVTSWIGNTTMTETVQRSSDGRQAWDIDYGVTQGWSPMVFAPTTPARACGTIANGAYSACTVWY